MFVWLLPASAWAGGWTKNLALTFDPSVLYRINIKIEGAGSLWKSTDGENYEEFAFNNCDYNIPLEKGQFFVCGVFKTVKIDVTARSTEALQTVALRGGPQLTYFELKDGQKLPELEFENCPLLETLQLDGCSDISLKATNTPKLKTLGNKPESFTSLELTNTGFETVTGDNLETVKLNNCSRVENIVGGNALRTIEAINCARLEKLQGCSALQTLDLENCAALEELNAITSLKSLKAKNCARLATLEGLSALETLRFESCGAITALTAGNALKSLMAKDCGKLTKVEAKGASQLTKIELSGCSGVALTANNCAKLSSLDLGNSVTTLTVENCSQLTSLNGGSKVRTLTVKNCDNLAALSAGSDLESLTLSNCSNISTLANVSKSSLRSLSVKSCGKITDIYFPSNSNIETVVATSCTGLNKLDVSDSKKLKSVEANPCKEVNTGGCSELTTLKVGNNLQKLTTSECKKLTKVEGTLSALTTFTCTRAGFTPDFLKGVIEGSNATKLETFEGYELNLPSQLVVKSSTLKKLDLYKSKNLTSFAVQGTSALEELELRATETLTDLNVLQAKKLKKLIIESTKVTRISLEGLDELEYVSMPSGYPARLLQELICQLHTRVNLNPGEFKYLFSTDEKKLVNGTVAKDKNWKIINTNQSGKDITSECTATYTCNDVVLPTTADEVHLELAANTTVRLKIAKPTMLWQSETSDKTKFFDNHYYATGNSDITISGKTNVYLFTQPGALAEITIKNADKVKKVELLRVPALKNLELTDAALLTSLNITNQKELTELKVTKAEKLTSIDLSQNTKLTEIEVEECGLTGSIDFSNHNVLTEVSLYKNELSSVKLGKAITELQVAYNQLTTLDLTPAAGLKKLYAYSNKLAEIKLAEDKSKYEYFDIERNSLVALDLQNAINLSHLLIHSNPNLANLNLRGCVKLKNLEINGCKAFNAIQKPSETTWFLDGCNALETLKIHKTGLSATELTKLYCKLPTRSAKDAKIFVVDKADATNPNNEAKKSGTKIAEDKGWKVLDSDKKPFEGDKNRTCDDLKPHDVPVIELVAAGETIVKFKTTAKELWIEDISGNFDYMETTPGQEVVRTLKPQFQSTYKFHGKISSFDINNQDKVQSLTIKKHDVLKELKANDCTDMKNVQLSGITNLEKLSINNSHVKELALATFPALKELNCAKNELTQLNFSANMLLEKVDCSENSGLKTITALKSVGSAPAPLKELKCGGSGLSIEAFNQLFCLLPERTSDAKGKLYAAKDANEANEKLVPDNCYTSRATKKHWEILLNDGSTASLGNEASGNHACEPEKVKTIKMDPITIIHGETMPLRPTIEPSYADNPKVKWTVKTGADKVKLYDATPAILEALNVGEATIEGVAEDGGGAKTEVKVTVREKQVETITIEPSIPSPFQIGDKVQFTAKVSPANATYRDITWSVDGGAATIDEATGFFVAKSATTNLVVTAKSSSPDHQKKAEYKVQIKAPDVKGLILSQKEITIKKDGKKYSVYATLDPSSAQFTGTIQANTAEPVVAVTCNPEYDQYGFIKQPFKIEVEGIIEGRETTVTIKPSAFPAISAELKVKVVTEFVDPTDIELPATLTATVGTPVKIEAKVLPETASNRTILWSLKDAQSAEVLKIDVEGNITPLKGGRAVVVATAAGKTDLKKECTVDVSIDAIPSHVKLMTTLTVAKNEEIPMQLAGTGEIFIKAASQVLQYSLTDAYYPVKVKSASGEIEIYGPLTKLEAKDAGDKITAIKFTSDARLTELNVSGNSIAELDVQALIELQKLNCANNKLSKLNVIRLTNLTELYCGNNTIAELDLLANANLEKLSCEGLGLNTLNLTTNARLKELVCYGNKFATTVYDEIYCTLPTTGGTMIPAKAKVAAGSNPNYDALIASSSQLATQKGWKVIYEDKTDIQTTGTKTACQEKPAESITIEPLTVKIGETKPIKYGLQPAGSTSVVTFKSLDTNIATVDDKGNVKGVKAGTVKIMLTTDVPSVNGICDVTVEAGTIELTGITIKPLSVKVGETKKIDYTLQPEGATATVSFKSLDESIATVDAQGYVKGVKEGKVKIEVTTDVATVKGECDVTVEATTPDPGVAVEDTIFANVLVAPNPFEADLRIVLDGESQGVKYELINANGSIVRKGTIVANDTRIETAELTVGIYILRLTSESGRTKSFTLVKK